MRKYLFILLTMTILSSCGGSYNAEKDYWHMNRKYSSVLKNPDKAVEKDFNEALSAIRSVIGKYPTWTNTAQLQFTLGELYSARKDSANALEEYKQVYVNYPEKQHLSAHAMFLVGFILEEQGKWDLALIEYNRVVAKYPHSMTGLQIPLYIARNYQERKMFEDSSKAYDLAVRSYLSEIEVNPYGEIVPLLQNFVILSFASRGNWMEAVSKLEYMVNKYPKTEGAPVALYKIALIYRNKLNRPEKAVEYYRKIISEYPNSKLGKNAQFDIGSISVLSGKIEEAQKEYENIFEKYSDDQSLCAIAQLAVAMGYEKNGKWDNALNEYLKLQKQYPQTVESMQSYLNVAAYFKKANLDKEYKETLLKAISNYDGIVASKTSNEIESAAQEFKANALLMTDNWKDAIDTLNSLRNHYPRSPRAPLALLKIGLVYQQGLKDTKKAVEVYTYFLNEYPKHSSSALVRKLIDDINISAKTAK